VVFLLTARATPEPEGACAETVLRQVVGAPFYDDASEDDGQVSLFRGSAAGVERRASWTLAPDAHPGGLGSTVGAAWDLDDDGFGDVFVGAPGVLYAGGAFGLLYVYTGSPHGPSAGPTWAVGYSQYDGLGDVNGDGFADLAVGAPRDETDDDAEGRAYVFAGSCVATS
jgi:hypothetical protein